MPGAPRLPWSHRSNRTTPDAGRERSILPGTPACPLRARKRAPRWPGAGRREGGQLRARPEVPGAPTTPQRPPRASLLRGAGAAEGRRAEAARLSLPGAGGGERRPPPSPACRAPAAPRPYRLHGVLQDGGELGEHLVPGLQQLLPGRPGELLDPPPPPLLRLPGPLQSEGRCGAGRTSRGPRRAGPAASGVLGRRGGSGGRGDVAGGEEGVPRGLWAPRRSGGGGSGSGFGSGSDTVAARLGFLPPALPAAACRGRRRGLGRPPPGQADPVAGRPDAAGAGEAPRGRGPPGAGSRAWPLPPQSPAHTLSCLRLKNIAVLTATCFSSGSKC